MNANQYLIVRLNPAMTHYEYWTVNGPPPVEAMDASANKTTSKSSLGTAIQNELPSLTSGAT